MSGESNVTILGFIRTVLQGRQRGGDQEAAEPRDVLLTPDRDLSVFGKLIGNDGTRDRIVKVEDSREIGIVLHGKDSDGNVDALKTNASKQLEVAANLSLVIPLILMELRVMNMHLDAMTGLGATIDDVEDD